ncbi:MAG: TetR family transcriptional regulator C-terminal domain-containing protein [Chloroflexi bacterium]|nr:TetR family transcriptional regulator C-terminal domain-containing protein [Chloroflexota bacterium]
MTTDRGKKSHLLERGAELVYQQGFHNTGINQILEAAGVPRGSFYFYFKNKEDFGLQLIDFFLSGFMTCADNHLQTGALPFLQRLKNFFDEFLARFEQMGFRGGCPIGNLSLEMSDLNEAMRGKLGNAFEQMQAKIQMFLEGAKEQGELDYGLDVRETAHVILNSWEGALLRTKVLKNSSPMHSFDCCVFSILLKSRTDIKKGG